MPQARHFIRAHWVKESDILAFQCMNTAQPPQLFTRLSGSHRSECFPGAGNNTWQVRNPIIPFGACERQSPSKESVHARILFSHCIAAVGDMMEIVFLGEWLGKGGICKNHRQRMWLQGESVCVCMCVCMCVLGCVCLTLCDPTDCSPPGSPVCVLRSISRQEYWSGLPFPPLGDLPGPGIECAPPALAGGFSVTEPPRNPLAGEEAPSLGWTGKAAEGKGARSGVQRKGGCYLGLVSLRASYPWQ